MDSAATTIPPNRQAGRAVVVDMLGEAFAAHMEAIATSGKLGSGMAASALDDCYGSYWTDPRLDRRSRSLVTLGILIALRAGAEIKNHVKGAISNGLTATEIEAAIEHSVPYVGYPTAGAALAVAAEVLAGHTMNLDLEAHK